MSVRVIASGGLDIYDSPNGNIKGHYDKGNVIRTLNLNNKKPADDGRVYAPYTVGGHRFMQYWIAVEDENGYATVEKI